MTQEQLWAPWRLPYIVSAKATAEPPGCFLCRYGDTPENDVDNYVVARSTDCLVVLNRFPYNNGHLLVAPRAHKGQLLELTDAELLSGMHWLQRITSVMHEIFTPDGFNIGLNLGHAAGAGLPGHLHWHLVPRWNGDTNFMTVLAETSIIPQSLAAAHALLSAALAK